MNYIENRYIFYYYILSCEDIQDKEGKLCLSYKSGRKRGFCMISYSPFWNTLERSNENWYTLTNKYNMSHSTLHRLKHNKDITTRTINDLCRILDCQVQDIMQYFPDDKDQSL